MVPDRGKETSQLQLRKNETRMSVVEEPACSSRRWYFSREEIEDNSPSRKDGIDHDTEFYLRKQYCSFIQELGMQLKLPQVTIAGGMLLCHRFYILKSHAKHDWQTMATVSVFLASKTEDTPRALKDIIITAYEITYKQDCSASQRIRQREVYDKQKELILLEERFLLSTIAFDVDIYLPYKPLVAALKELGLRTDLGKVAWNFVNDWLKTTLCLEYRPHYIAAGSIFLAAKYEKVKLPTNKGNHWLLLFNMSPKQLEGVIKEMFRLFEQDKKLAVSPEHRKCNPSKTLVPDIGPQTYNLCAATTETNSSSENMAMDTGSIRPLAPKVGQSLASDAVIKKELTCGTSDSGSGSSVVEDDDGGSQMRIKQSDHNNGDCKFVPVHVNWLGIDADRIREALKRRKIHEVPKDNLVEASSPDMGSQAWIENELENVVPFHSM